MFFSKKEKDKDVEKIKQAMNELPEEEPNLDELSGFTDFSEIQQTPEMPEPTYAKRKEYVENYEVPKAPQRKEYSEYDAQKSAPLFVKVDKYKELLHGVNEIRAYLSSTKQVFTILQDIETIRSDALKVLRATLQRMEKSVVEVDSELLRPRGAEFPDEPSEVTHMETSLNELQKQLVDLKRELQQLK
jgi:hypothetical protein